MTALRQDLARPGKRYRLMLIMLVLIVMGVWVPLVPYSPECEDPRIGLSDVSGVWLAPAYHKEFTAGLRISDVPYIAIGGLVLIRVWDWLDGAADALINTSGKALYALVDADWGADASRLPANVQELLARHTRRDGWVQRDCELMRAVAIEGW